MPYYLKNIRVLKTKKFMKMWGIFEFIIDAAEKSEEEVKST